MWPHNMENLQSFLKHINSITQTSGSQRNEQIPVLITKLPGGQLSFSVYRKPFHTGKHVHASSIIIPFRKLALSGLFPTAFEQCHIKLPYPTKNTHLTTALRANRYSRALIKKLHQKISLAPFYTLVFKKCFATSATFILV